MLLANPSFLLNTSIETAIKVFQLLYLKVRSSPIV